MTNRNMTIFNPNRMIDDSFFDSFFNRTLSEYHPNELEMYEEADNIIVRVKAPGFNEENLDISVEDNVLTITGSVSNEAKEENNKKKYYYREIRNESFSRSVSLPARVKAENCNANIKNGILEIKLPKAEESKPKKITIKASK